jgi:hypothetical protein
MTEAQRECEIVESTETQALLERVFEAVSAYSEFLERQGLIWEDREDTVRLKASALVITVDYGAGGDIDVRLKDGALDRVYGNGTNPDPFGAGPSDIPRTRLRENR